MSGILPISPEEAARLPGPPVNLPQVAEPATGDAAPPQGQVIDVRPVGTEAPTQPAEGALTPPPPPPAPPPAEQAQTAEPPAARTLQGPRGTAAAVPDDLAEVGGLLDLLRRASRVRPEPAPVRPQEFVELGRRQIAVRAATAEEMDEVATILGRQTPQQVRLISTRGAYMPTDVQEFMSAVRLANTSLFDEMKRGVQTRDQQIDLAQRMGFDGAVEMLLRRGAGATLNNEGLISGALAVINAQRETEMARQALAALPADTPEATEALVRFGLNHALTAAIAAQLNGAAAEAGRALGALRFVADAMAQVPPSARGQVGPEAMRIPAGQDPQSIIEALGGEEALRTQAAIWATLPNPAARTAFAQRSMGRRVVDAIIAAYVNSLLWLPTTHMRNILGTTTMTLWQVPETFLAGAIGRARTAAGIGPDERVVMSEGLAQLYGIWAGQGEALSAAAQAFRTAQPANGFSRLELDIHRNPISAEALQISGTMGRAVDLLGVVLTIPGRGLVTADSYFQTIAQRMAFLQQAVRQRDALVRGGMSRADAALEVERMLANPPEQWREAAEEFARSMTFQDEMTGALGQLRDVMQHPLAKLYVPFFSTPTNVARAVINRSPVALMIPGQVWADIRAGGARADLAMSRLALGSMLMWWASGLVMNFMDDENFRITGSEPGEPARREAWRRQGFQPFSFCSREDGGWTCRSYAGFDPLSGLLAMAADMAQYTAENPRAADDGPGMEELAAGAAFGLYEYMLSQPFLTGVSDLAQTLIGNSNMNARERFERAIEMTTGQVADAVISPLTMGTMAGGVERAIDPTSRSTRIDDPEWAQASPVARGFYQAMTRAQARMPLASERLEPTLNIWGEEVRRTDGGLPELFWPIRTTAGGQADDLETLLLRLGGVLAMPSNKFPQTNVNLTAGQYNALLRAMNSADNRAGNGMTMRDEMIELISGAAFREQDPADQVEQIRGIRSLRWRAAQEDVLGIDTDLNRRVQRDRAYREHFGRSPRDEGAPMPVLQ